MKNIKRILFILAGACLLSSCSKSDNLLVEDQLENSLKKGHSYGHANPHMVTVPFKADLSVWDNSDYSDISCGGYPVFFLTMKGNGTASHLGKLTTIMTFCCDVSTGKYYNTMGTFVAANGDELYFEVPLGQIFPNTGNDSLYYQTRFNDPMIFTGGTGRFEGASGSGYTHAYVHDGTDEWRTDFFSTGSLTLIKGK